ncbi:hypothetical protein Poli38472_004222 [Pythium oligandrum]|uniref:Uncharacterized protein n=1 Tax=Pythium oligandrum TaxID=41045 RepID=A0A8K1CMU7_PYTOL|nr:hypothetical protein Poli38472_004222 [Pythium oligandrum]|eukprot:TMW66457.1 hypothetical protein Poli38472_004222 [Pythium oligandrum]
MTHFLYIYVYSIVESGVYGVHTLFGAMQANDNFGGYKADFITSFAGTKAIKESPLFTQVLAGDSTPLQDTIYLESLNKATFTQCDRMAEMSQWLYSNEFIRSHWDDLISQTSYNLSLFRESELIVPVVDCSFSAIAMGDITSARVFYLMRKKADPTDVFLIVISFSTQDYSVPDQFQNGPAIYAAIVVIRDMREAVKERYRALSMSYPFEGPYYSVYTLKALSDDGFVILENVPDDPTVVYKRILYTSNRSGYYLKSEESQANLKNTHWMIYEDPVLTLSKWQWAGFAIMRNSWGWARCVHFIFAIDTILNLFILMIVIYRNYQRRKIWVGDAFVSISTSLQIRAVSVVAIWAMENFWQLSVMTLQFGSSQGKLDTSLSYPQIMHGDFMMLYVALTGFLGTIVHERIDPGLTIILYEIGYRSSAAMATWFPAINSKIIAYALKDYLSGISNISFALNGYSPFGYWATHELIRDAPAIFAAMTPMFMTFIIVILYAVIRKGYRHYNPSSAIAYSSRLTNGSSNMSEGKAIKSPFTLFELATGAELQNRVGLVSDYDNCVFIKGMRYSSADGIFCNGFVIANSRWLIRMSDLWSVFLIIMTGTRLRDVYGYEVKDHKANQAAVLVYPKTMSLEELTKINTTVLA